MPASAKGCEPVRREQTYLSDDSSTAGVGEPPTLPDSGCGASLVAIMHVCRRHDAQKLTRRRQRRTRQRTRKHAVDAPERRRRSRRARARCGLPGCLQPAGVSQLAALAAASESQSATRPGCVRASKGGAASATPPSQRSTRPRWRRSPLLACLGTQTPRGSRNDAACYAAAEAHSGSGAHPLHVQPRVAHGSARDRPVTSDTNTLIAKRARARPPRLDAGLQARWPLPVQQRDRTLVGAPAPAAPAIAAAQHAGSVRAA